MASATYPVGLVKDRGETLALSTTVASFGVPPGMQQVMLYNPATDFRAHFNPKLVGAAFYDASASVGSRFKKDGSTSSLLEDLRDRDSGTGSGTLLDSATASDYLYLCFSDIVAGFHIVVKSANGTANTLTAQYYNASSDLDAGFWGALTETDNTDTGASLAQDGTVTFTAPTDWVAASLGGPNGILADDNTDRETEATGVLVDDASLGSGDTTIAVDTVDATTKFKDGDVFGLDSELIAITTVDSATQLTVIRGVLGTTAASHDNNKELFRKRDPEAHQDPPGTSGFWIRLSWDNGLDSDTEIEEVWSLNKDTTRGYFRLGVEYHISLDRRVIGAVEALVASGTDTLELTWTGA